MVLLPALKPACSSVTMFSTCGFNLFNMIFSMTAWVADEADCLVVLALLQVGFLRNCAKDWVHAVGHSPVFQILLQIVVRAVSTSSPPAWTSSAGMLSTPADFRFLNDCSPLLCEGWGGRSLCVSRDSSVLMVLNMPCDCTAQSSILSIGSASVVLL